MAPAQARDLDLLTRQFKALSDPNRLRIVDRLRGGERCVCDLQDLLDAGQSLLSFHLKTLKDAGLVADRRAGRWSYYRVNGDALAVLASVLGELSNTAHGRTWKPVCCS